MTAYIPPAPYCQAFVETTGEAADFLAAQLAAAPAGPVLSLGCGPGDVEAAVARSTSRAFVGLDLDPAMAREAHARLPGGRTVRARIEALPLSADRQWAAVWSGLLSLAYVTDEAALARTLDWIAAALAPGGLLALELPVAHHPARLQGLEESGPVAPGVAFRFRWLDVERQTPWGALVHSELTIADHTRREPLAVFTPAGIAQLLAATRSFTQPEFCAPYDAATATATPPPDCLRAIVLARRR